MSQHLRTAVTGSTKAAGANSPRTPKRPSGRRTLRARFSTLTSGAIVAVVACAAVVIPVTTAHATPTNFNVGEFRFATPDSSAAHPTAEIRNWFGSGQSVQIPGTVSYQSKTYTITGTVDYLAVFRNKNLTSVDFSQVTDSFVQISPSTFENNQLTAVEIPASVTTIGKRAFYKNSLTAVTIPSAVPVIGEEAFTLNQLTQVTFEDTALHPSQLTQIGQGAFAYNQLTSIEIPETVTEIGISAFSHNALAGHLTLPSGLTALNTFVFQNNQLTSVKIPDGVTSIGVSAFANNHLEGTLHIPAAVQTIGTSAFQGNPTNNMSHLQEVTFEDTAQHPSQLTTIGTTAFQNNDLTGSITIPAQVTEIGNNAFNDNNLSDVYFAGDAPHTFTAGTTSVYTGSFGVGGAAGPLLHFVPTATDGGSPITAPTWKGYRTKNGRTHQVTFNAFAVPRVVTVDEGYPVAEPSPAPTRIGYGFNGWRISSQHWQTYDFSSPVMKDLTLYDTWYPKSYILWFNANGGSPVPPSRYVLYGQSPTLPTDLTRDGYTFGGWFTDEALTVPYANPFLSETTVYAKWLPAVHTVAFDSQGGSDVTALSGVAYETLIDRPADPTRTGHTFDGWYRDTTFTVAWDFSNDTVTADHTLYAKWTVNTYPVLFDTGQDGSAVAQ